MLFFISKKKMLIIKLKHELQFLTEVEAIKELYKGSTNAVECFLNNRRKLTYEAIKALGGDPDKP